MNPLEQLNVTREIDAVPDRVFEAWTSPDQIVRWWGGGGITCPEAEVDLRPGGAYRIANAAPDGTTTWISGVFEVIERPNRLVYTWSVEPAGAGASPALSDPAPSIVDVEFRAVDGGTRVIIHQIRIPGPQARELFEAGWNGCLDGLRTLLAGSSS